MELGPSPLHLVNLVLDRPAGIVLETLEHARKSYIRLLSKWVATELTLSLSHASSSEAVSGIAFVHQ